MNALIKGQEIGIDDHSRGRETGWGKKLHIHKRFTDGRRGGFEILVPFNHDDEVEIRPGRCPSDQFMILGFREIG